MLAGSPGFLPMGWDRSEKVKRRSHRCREERRERKKYGKKDRTGKRLT